MYVCVYIYVCIYIYIYIYIYTNSECLCIERQISSNNSMKHFLKSNLTNLQWALMISVCVCVCVRACACVKLNSSFSEETLDLNCKYYVLYIKRGGNHIVKHFFTYQCIFSIYYI